MPREWLRGPLPEVTDLLYWQPAAANQPLRDYLDLDNFPEHRVYYFPNLFRVDDRRLAILKERVFCNGHVVVWGPGSGISDGTRLSADNAQRLTGFEMKLLEVNSQRRVAVVNYDHPVGAELPPGVVYGGSLPYGPVLFPQDGAELGLAWTKWACNEVGLAIKEFGRGAGVADGGGEPRGAGDWASVFTVAAQLPADLWRSLGRHAGAHVYCEENEVVMADSSVVALHSVKSGTKRLSLPGRYRLTDVVRGTEHGADCSAAESELCGPGTAVFLLEDTSG